MVDILLFLTNASCMAIALFLVWLYYKWDDNRQAMGVLLACLLYQWLFQWFELLGQKFILTGLFTLIFAKITYAKCQTIAKAYRQKTGRRDAQGAPKIRGKKA
ncbi:Uncharacterised protein [Pasteurella multocida]|uniref:hypothetical protein n=1 Tax=Pasteurella multocida TaxID=747 RepID=UPI000E04187B|nr:hypothetical protein [Pasteurella multocida]SUB37595.1 Uncharacterised protein [Pasteurella multocida]SUB37598.1 Uncharacterised protein [Pasteurella multocida]